MEKLQYSSSHNLAHHRHRDVLYIYVPDPSSVKIRNPDLCHSDIPPEFYLFKAGTLKYLPRHFSDAGVNQNRFIC